MYYDSSAKHTALIIALAFIAGTGCSSNSGTPTDAGAPIAANGLGTAASALNVSGRYNGKVQDSIFGSGQIYADLAQFESSIGGLLTFEYGSTVFITPATFLLKGKALSGSGVIGNLNGGLCNASESATYSSHKLTGSYTVENACSNDNGSFILKQTCHYAQGGTAFNLALKSC